MCVHVCQKMRHKSFRTYLHFSSTAPKYRHLFRFVTAKTHTGETLARQGAALAVTVARRAQHDARRNAARIIILLVTSFAVIVCNRISIRWFLAQLNHQVCGVNLRKLTVRECLEAKGLLPLGPQRHCGLLQRNCGCWFICCSSRHFTH